jgi:hypothetical protein
MPPANLILLGSSPLESVQAYDSIQGIWVGGQHLLPGDLEADRQRSAFSILEANTNA